MSSDKIEISKSDLWTLVLSTLRYSMGRRSYITALTPEIVKRYSGAFTEDQLRQIMMEIEDGLRIEAGSSGYMGMMCDVSNWSSLAKWCREELSRERGVSGKESSSGYIFFE